MLIDDAFEAICKARLGRRWEHLSPNGVKEIMSKGWERSYKRQFKPTNDPDKEYIVSIPAEAFEKTGVDDTSKLPHIKKGRIHFKGYGTPLLSRLGVRVSTNVVLLDRISRKPLLSHSLELTNLSMNRL